MDYKWQEFLECESAKSYYEALMHSIAEQEALGHEIYPPLDVRFAAFEMTAFDDVKVVILGQDPYHGAGQAHGLSFSVLEGVKVPPSLRNIYKELHSDLITSVPRHGNLSAWARQGVLLLNTSLTVNAGTAGSHSKFGWQKFTDAAIGKLNEEREGLVFVLWGAPAQKKTTLIDEARHLILKAPHPSPLSAHRGFFGSKPFSQANTYLQARGETPIDWSLA
ncbi:uracil-DNA glycosylase [Polycladidibacter stylochi]|uniref:uracil-DNA glycosylase n=1 Tax=Polycladidibacter stylochi TaxID=1807766 RepID=UPI0008308453|nr:uracil-DNA glycosylase [Pseudovibrio stylochi]